MSIVTIVDNAYITVEYDFDRKTIQHVVHQPLGSDLLHEAMDAGTKALREYGACKWLSDDRKNGPISQDEAEWGKAWGLRTIAAGWKYWAMVVPEEIVAAGSMMPAIEEYYNLGLRVMVFSNRDDALAWLARKPD